MPYRTSTYFVMSEFSRPIIAINDPLFATAYDELTFWSSRFGALLFKNLELLPGIQILDLGCATGFPSFELAQVHGSSSRVFGVDIWKEAVFRAAARKRFFQLKCIELIAADASFLPFPKNRFDLIVSNLGLNNFEDPPRVLAECHRVAKPHARIVITTNLQGHYREFYDVFRKVLQRLGKLNCFDKLAANEQHRGTQESVCRLMKDAGFKVARVISDEFQMRFFDGTSLLDHVLTRIGFLTGWQGVVDEKDRDRVFEILEQELNDIATSQGYLTMTVPMLYVEARAS